MTSLAYTCKFCRKPGFVHADESGLSIIRPEKWLPNVCCNRCGQYMERKRSIREALFKVCHALYLCRCGSSSKKAETEKRIMDHLITLTKKLATLVCDYYRVMNVWEQDLPQAIFSNPGKLSVIASVYINGIKAEAKKLRPVI